MTEERFEATDPEEQAAQINAVVDSAVQRVKEAWLADLRRVADDCEGLAETVRREDEACASSMDFVALRLRRVVERSS